MVIIWHFREFFHFYPILDYHKIRTRTNFEKSQREKFRSTSNNVIYAERIVPGLNRFYSDHFQNTPNIKTFSAMLLELWFRESIFPKYTNWKTIVKTKIEKEADDWFLFCSDHRSMRVAEECLENIPPSQLWPLLIVIRTL